MAHVPPKLTMRDLEDVSTILELREAPVMAAQLILNRDYDPVQALALHGVWTHPFSMLDQGRGTGKTLIASDIEILSGILYPGTQSLVASYGMKGTKLVFDELIKTYQRSPLVKKSVPKRPTKGSDICTMLFNSMNQNTGQQTIIKGIASDINRNGDGVRGNRASRILHVDEWVYIPLNIITGAIFPCASTTDDPTMPEYDLKLTRFLLTSSSGYTYMPHYEFMKTYRDRCLYPEKFDDAIDEFGNNKYFYLNINYTHFTKKGIINLENVGMWKATFPVQKFEVEVMAKWGSDSGSWYNAQDLIGNPEKPQEDSGIFVDKEEHPLSEYRPFSDDDTNEFDVPTKRVLAIDPAEQSDETGLCGLLVTPDYIYISETEGFLGTSMSDVSEIVRDYVDRYKDTASIVMDPEGGGRSTVTHLMEAKRIKSNRNAQQVISLPICLISEDWKKMASLKNSQVPPGARQILKFITASSNKTEGNVTDMNTTLRTLIKNKKILACKNSSEEFKVRLDKLFEQVMAVDATPVGENKNLKEGKYKVSDKGKFSFSSRIKKDRYSALLIGVWEAVKLQTELNIADEPEEIAMVEINNIFSMGQVQNQFFGHDESSYLY